MIFINKLIDWRIVMEEKVLPTRGEVPESLTWDLATIFKNDDEFETEFMNLQQAFHKFMELKSNLTASAEYLLQAVKDYMDLNRRLERVYVYSELKNDQDTSIDKYQSMKSKVEALVADFGSQTAWIQPEILKISAKQMQEFYNQAPELKDYQRFFDQIFENRDHILDDKVEQVLAGASDIFNSGSKTFGILDNTDLSFPSIENEDGQMVKLSSGVYSVLLESSDRRVRREAFEKLYEVYGQFQHTLASTLTSTVKDHNFNAKIRSYDSALTAALNNTEIPSEVYHNLIKVVNKNLPLLHRYVKLRKKILGVPELHMYDMYTSLLKDPAPSYKFSESKDLSLEALRVLGSDYIKNVQSEFDDRWIDVVENQYKRSGGYSSGSYDTNPFILLNWHDNLDNLYTLIHETGHSMHSFYSHNNQPYQTGDYPIFVAEIASTTNENLLTDYLLKLPDPDKSIRKYVLNYYLDEFKGTVFRQAQFAEFEEFIHEQDAKGTPLTANFLNDKYLELNQKYYGNDVISDDQIALEWSRIPHFYYDFYVYQYATGFSAATTLADKIINGSDQDTENYLNFLKSGSSKKPIDTMKLAGIDMTKPDYLQVAFDIFEQRLNEFESFFE